MRARHNAKTEEVSQFHEDSDESLDAVQGEHTSSWGHVGLAGDVSRLRGSLAGLTGLCKDLAGEVSLLQGNVSGIKGLVDEQLVGDVTGLHGDVIRFVIN